MSAEQIEQSLLQLPLDERRRFVDWIYRNETKIIESKTDDELSSEAKTEILRRREMAEAHPELLEPWDGTTERLHRRLNEIRAQKTVASGR